MAKTFHEKAVEQIKNIPSGKIATYGQIAALSGSPKAARQVVRCLHSSSEKEKLPWHRVINSQGKIGLKSYQGYEMQKAMLEDEGIVFGLNDIVDFNKYQWNGK